MNENSVPLLALSEIVAVAVVADREINLRKDCLEERTFGCCCSLARGTFYSSAEARGASNRPHYWWYRSLGRNDRLFSRNSHSVEREIRRERIRWLNWFPAGKERFGEKRGGDRGRGNLDERGWFLSDRDSEEARKMFERANAQNVNSWTSKLNEGLIFSLHLDLLLFRLLFSIIPFAFSSL